MSYESISKKLIREAFSILTLFLLSVLEIFRKYVNKINKNAKTDIKIGAKITLQVAYWKKKPQRARPEKQQL